MFTGIVEERATVSRAGPRLVVAARVVSQDAEPGASIAVNGVCLTVVERASERGDEPGAALAFDLSPETLSRSTLGDLRDGDPVNLERPVTLLTRMGGHLVQGHVDGVGDVEAVRPVEGGVEMAFSIPGELERYVVEKGSIAVDGVSLTVTGTAPGRFEVALIPHTLEATTLGARRPGDRVNLEVDIMSKYVESLLGGTR
ncbi:MAG TPA: riboflavin synthase [Actinomycetota bacterium]|jgi:riboflavin synthase